MKRTDDMPTQKDKPERTAAGEGGIPKAVREGAEAADGNVVEIEESRRGQRPGGTPNPVEIAAKTVMVRAIASRGGGTDGLARIQQTAADLVRGAGDADVDLGAAVKGAVSGAIDAGYDTGIGKQEAARAAAIGAIEGAGEIGEAAVEHVKNLVTGPIGTTIPLSRSLFAEGRRAP